MSRSPDEHQRAGRDLVSRLNRIFARIAEWSFDHRWTVTLLGALLVTGALAAASGARVDNSYEAYFHVEDPSYTAYADYRDDFGSDEVSYLVYEAPDREDGVWDLDVMRRVAALTEALQDEVPFVFEVTSLANAEVIEAVPDGIRIHAIEDEFPTTQRDMDRWRDLITAKPMYAGSLVSRDGRYGGILLEMDRASTDPLDEIRLDPEGGDAMENLYPQVSEATIESILARPEYADLVFHHSGDVPINSAYNRIIGEESTVLGLLTSGVVALILALFFRSAIGVIGPIVVVQISVIATVAVVVLLGWKLDMMFASVPTLLTAIGVAHSVHILAAFQTRMAEHGERRRALRETLHTVGAPCLLTSLTTAVGFAALATSPIKALSHMGVYSAAGVMLAFVLSFTLLLAFLSFGRGTRAPGRAKAASSRLSRGLQRLADLVPRHRRTILAGFAAVFLASFAGMTLLVVDSNWIEDFSDAVPVKHAIQLVDREMGGSGSLIYLFDTGREGGVKDPAVLREIQRLQQVARAEDWMVRHSMSLVDVLEDLNQQFHDGDPAFHRVPETRELVAQYLLLYETSGGGEAQEYVSSDYSRASLELRLRMEKTSEMARLTAILDEAMRREPVQQASVATTGIGALWLRLIDYITVSQIRGFLLAFGAITAMMCVIFRSIPTGLISMVPNLAPVFLTLGVMGWMGLPLDYNKLMIATVAIGIAVDDTIHLMARYREAFRQTGDYVRALHVAMGDVGRALVITSVSLVLGFLVLLGSLLDSQATFGVLLAGTIVTALIADFLLMPALVLTFQPFGPPVSGAGEAERPLAA